MQLPVPFATRQLRQIHSTVPLVSDLAPVTTLPHPDHATVETQNDVVTLLFTLGANNAVWQVYQESVVASPSGDIDISAGHFWKAVVPLLAAITLLALALAVAILFVSLYPWALWMVPIHLHAAHVAVNRS